MKSVLSHYPLHNNRKKKTSDYSVDSITFLFSIFSNILLHKKTLLYKCKKQQSILQRKKTEMHLPLGLLFYPLLQDFLVDQVYLLGILDKKRMLQKYNLQSQKLLLQTRDFSISLSSHHSILNPLISINIFGGKSI